MAYKYYFLTTVFDFGSKHATFFGLSLYSKLEEFEDVFNSKGIKYQKQERNGKISELTIERDVVLFLSPKAEKFNFAIASNDGIHASCFYFYTEYDKSTDILSSTTANILHDLFIKDSRVSLKEIKNNKKECHYVRDYLSLLEVARIEKYRNSLSVTIVSKEYYKKLPKYRWPSIKAGWFLWPVVALVYFGPAIYGLSNSDDDIKASGLMDTAVSDNRIYICTGPQSKSYHIDANCYGLQSCSADIAETTVEQAKDEGRKPCRYCCK